MIPWWPDFAIFLSMWQSRDDTIRLCDEAADRIKALEREVKELRVGIAKLDDERTGEAAARIAAEAREARYETALFNIAHTFTEDSHGGTKCLPGTEYQAMARAALAGSGSGWRE